MIAETVREITAAITRKAPSFPGLGLGWSTCNTLFLKFGARPITRAQMHNGTSIIVDLRSNTEVEAYYRGAYDEALVGSVLSIFDPDTLFLDIGANIGFYTVAAANFIRRKGGCGCVISFEPLPENFERLVHNLKLNDLDAYCRPLNVGLSDADRHVELVLREDFQRNAATGNASIAIGKTIDHGFPTTSIQVRQLDQLWAQIADPAERIGLVKLDIEGHEDCCLQGAHQTFASHRPTILLEVNKPYYEARVVDLDAKILSALPAGYVIFRQVSGHWQQTRTLHACNTVDNVLLIPEERRSSGMFRDLLC